MPSSAAEAWLAALPDFSLRPYPPSPADLEGWRAWQARAEIQGRARSATVLDGLAAINRVSVEVLDEAETAIRLTPDRMTEGAPRFLFLHGGGFTAFSAASTLFAAAPIASALGVEVVTIDYPKAPFSTCLEIVETVRSRLLPHLGPDTILVGDSAGGGLALAVTHLLKARGDRLPAGLVLWSPWVDLKACDPKADDPILRYTDDLEVCAACYAGPLPMNDPLASPVMAAYGPWHPPTLIQAGSREIFVPSLQRLMTKMLAAGADCRLQITDGLFHSFIALAHDLPESGKAMLATGRFIDEIVKRRV